MAKKEKPHVKKEDIPAWFMTYSDVITLLMTFFILLLTFASSEPEKFERLQVSLFQGSGATGFAGSEVTVPEKDAIVMRTRPRASRLTMDGSEMPPMYTDPVVTSEGKALKAITDEERRETARRHYFDLPFNQLFETDGSGISAGGRQHLHMLAGQLRRLPFDSTFTVSMATDPAPLWDLTDHLVREEGIKPGRIAMSQYTLIGLKPQTVRVELTQQTNEDIR